MAIVDAVDTPAIAALALAGMADDRGPSEPGLDTVVVDMNAEALADQTYASGERRLFGGDVT
ncbi:MAG: hypothetical protein IPM60_02240 [Rhodospirillales bacterium]|nr:hypothetical protein [Rhodospirillales bacterium]